MKLNTIPFKKTLNKAYQKVKPNRTDINRLKANLQRLLQRIDHEESEENVKNHLRDFLNDTYYNNLHLLNTKGRTDLVIHNENSHQSQAAVLFEVKRPKNNADMIGPANANAKAMQEMALYYLRERIEAGNTDIKYLVITNIYEWYIFDAATFDRLFFQNKTLVRDYEDWKNGRKIQSTTDFFYKDIARPFLDQIQGELSAAYFNIKDYEVALLNDDEKDDKRLIPLYKVFSPQHLLKLPFANDSNSLDKGFYNELLYLIGLEEEKEGGKKIIRRCAPERRQPGSMLENALNIIAYEDRMRHVHNGDAFDVALELCITWVNRILFLKLLESQLVKYHQGEPGYRFLTSKLIHDYDGLNKLFFQVLAEIPDQRSEAVRAVFGKVPYLNSSLFEITEKESAAIRINSLEDELTMPLHPRTVLKDDKGKARTGRLDTLQYLFAFLDAYDFSSEGSEEIQEENKTLINASVLGLIFEKINGYRDGSFFTPGFITMYMSRETVRRAVVQKFNEAYSFGCEDLGDLANHLAQHRNKADILEHNKIVNSLRICDPAVGSGHFLVSALNELIAVKSELGILADREGVVLRGYETRVENDELIVTCNDGQDLFEYRLRNGAADRDTQRVQETLFHEKQAIIENCLFGVDINPNSVKICRLRLWIELLKNTYYQGGLASGGLETLPNIDINIKTGNSLISRFTLDADLKQALKKSNLGIEVYRIAVHQYHRATSKDEKRELERLLNQIKTNFKTEIGRNDPLRKRIEIKLRKNTPS
jgi:adenine-specific DNA-methyltransferase